VAYLLAFLSPVGNRKEWLRQQHPTSQFENTVGSTGWQDLRRQRDQARSWINERPTKRSCSEADEDDPEAEGD
jgi:hypothetical protein